MKFFVIALTILLVLAISWAGTCGIIWLICLCFGWAFSLQIATGVWLALLLLGGLFNKNK